MPEFDKDVFELMIEKVIIGEKEENGDVNPRVITFILKSGNEIKCEDNKNSIVKENLTVGEDKNHQSSYEVGQNYLQKVCEPCGKRGSATTKTTHVILDFDMVSAIITFEEKGKFGKEKHQNLGVKVRVVA